MERGRGTGKKLKGHLNQSQKKRKTGSGRKSRKKKGEKREEFQRNRAGA